MKILVDKLPTKNTVHKECPFIYSTVEISLSKPPKYTYTKCYCKLCSDEGVKSQCKLQISEDGICPYIKLHTSKKWR